VKTPDAPDRRSDNASRVSAAVTETGARGDHVCPGAPGEPTAIPPYLESSGELFAPTRVAQGPWGETMAGHVVGGLLGWALERDAGDPAWQPTRLTVDLLRPTLLQPVGVTTHIIRNGRRVRLAEATVTQNGETVARASAVFLRRSEPPSQQVWSAPVSMPPVPAPPTTTPRRSPFFLRAYGWGPDAPTGHEGQPAVAPKYAWVNEIRPLIDNRPLTAFTRAAMAADVTNPLVHWGTAGMQFINADYTLTLSRLPDGPYLGLAAQTHYSHDGVATGMAVVSDQHGPIGITVANALSDNRFRSPFTPQTATHMGPAHQVGPGANVRE